MITIDVFTKIKPQELREKLPGSDGLPVKFCHPKVGKVSRNFQTSIFRGNVEYLGGGFKHFYVHPYLGKIPNLTTIFRWNLKPPTSEYSLMILGSSWSMENPCFQWVYEHRFEVPQNGGIFVEFMDGSPGFLAKVVKDRKAVQLNMATWPSFITHPDPWGWHIYLHLPSKSTKCR